VLIGRHLVYRTLRIVRHFALDLDGEVDPVM
jgi:hypothetical protein